MIVIIILWLACGFLAAGWAKADDTATQPCAFTNVSACFFIAGGAFTLILVSIYRVSDGEAYGWQFPFQRVPFKGHWFKRR